MCFMKPAEMPPVPGTDDNTEIHDLPEWGDFPTADTTIIVHVVQHGNQAVFYFTTTENYQTYVIR